MSSRKAIGSSEYVEGIRAAADIITVAPEQVRNLIRTGQLKDYGDGKRYGRRIFLRSECDFLAIPENRIQVGRPIGSVKVK